MIDIKRLEIVVDARSGSMVTELLEQVGLSGWTQIPRASGSGDRGQRRDDELTGVASNTVVIAACPPERLDAVVEGLRPILRRHGGICLVSDARWIVH